MITQPAKVIAETPSNYLLETLPKSACPRCEAGNGCGGGILASAFANKKFELHLDKKNTNKKSLHIDDLIQIGIPSSVLIKASLLLYLLPLIAMICGAILLGHFTENRDLYTVIGATLGMLFGFVMGKFLSAHLLKVSNSTPVLIENDEDSCWYKAN